MRCIAGSRASAPISQSRQHAWEGAYGCGSRDAAPEWDPAHLGLHCASHGRPASRSSPALGRAHARRLREIYRSAGWPCQDLLEIELLAAGLLDRVRSPSGHESLRVTRGRDAAAGRRRWRATARALSAHEALVERVALEMGRAGRVAWRGLSLRAQVPADDAGKPLRSGASRGPTSSRSATPRWRSTSSRSCTR